MNIFDIIEKKRDGKKLSKEEIDFFISGVCDGSIKDYQTSALLMACYIKKLNIQETLDLTYAMRDSGEKANLSKIKGIKVDKHSTGGVGDKTTLIIAPMLASCGLKVAKMTGRGLGHTGGTIDKLESIKGINLSLSPEEFIEQVNNIGISVIGQSKNFAPADKILYSLRDTTATIDSIPLIASSVMSKKLACGCDALLLDVKFGSGAFCHTKKMAIQLAKLMVSIGKNSGMKTCALITDMNIPLGHNIGNSIEIEEALECLNGKSDYDLKYICYEIVANLLMCTLNISHSEAIKRAEESINNKSALNKFYEMIKCQNGDLNYLSDIPNKATKHIINVISNKSGYISKMKCKDIGQIACMLGAGRKTKEDDINYLAGIKILKKYGEKINKNDIIAVLYTDIDNIKNEMIENYNNCIYTSKSKPKKHKKIVKIIK